MCRQARTHIGVRNAHVGVRNAKKRGSYNRRFFSFVLAFFASLLLPLLRLQRRLRVTAKLCPDSMSHNVIYLLVTITRMVSPDRRIEVGENNVASIHSFYKVSAKQTKEF